MVDMRDDRDVAKLLGHVILPALGIGSLGVALHAHRFLADNAATYKRVLHCRGKKPVLAGFGFCPAARYASRLQPRQAVRNQQMNQKFVIYFKRMGLAAFLFFLIKGLAWLVVFYFGWQMVG